MKDKIINAALAVFSQKGYNASLNDISNIVGIKNSLYIIILKIRKLFLKK